jgi:hypothetical protein
MFGASQLLISCQLILRDCKATALPGRSGFGRWEIRPAVLPLSRDSSANPFTLSL